MAFASSTLSLEQKNLRLGLMALIAAAAMVGVGFAAVPMYRLFCQVTGFAGTTQVASETQAAEAERAAAIAGAPPISIRFDASTARDMPWTFAPVHTTDTIRIGTRDLAFYTARNNADVPITGTATFNVEPEQAAPYFNKIQCFCFTEQTLQAGEEVRMPVLFYVDPAALDDPNMEGVEQITLSYTFHRKPPEES
ncbi:cytochrome c oxidase assembly protein [Alteriqipengyuania lutimaris]|uniref:Cytochrome c oxidase assembly protein CtaG n=1 Tax=Alteriqipengyuania lutimaris TaxID=1538146 RepID=A0A395LQ99_9SPHN|nr:cytochrome c oxidase assembly protein [Alteriqipengyuania lutimaris]MBB3033197.1 cytochrome c oxidase assembly protein subunit 11 [Alteriqipengyuania lutimaris]RDS77754.1 cytochrome c oxidase assembly protein [Alteriqipengyuania lutimaris]